MMSEQSLAGAHPFPLIRGGGLFLLVVGASIVLGACSPRRLWSFFIGGVVAASASVLLTALPLTAPLGRPTAFQIGSLLVAVIAEVTAVAWLSRWLRRADERRRILSILMVVGVHFLVMAPAFGPLVVVLGLLSVANAAAGLHAAATPWPTFWFVDGTLKAGIGGAMFWWAPRITWW